MKKSLKEEVFVTNNLKSADIQLIKRIIPHRYPFLLVDKVIEIDYLKSAKGIKNVTFNEPYFQGHFPGFPIMPGVTIVEALAQTAAVMVGVSLDLADKNLLIYFMGIDNCKFRRKVVPGDRLELKVNVLRGKLVVKFGNFLVQRVLMMKLLLRLSLLP